MRVDVAPIAVGAVYHAKIGAILRRNLVTRSLVHYCISTLDGSSKEMTRLDRINWSLERVRDFCLGEWFMKVIFNNVKKSFYVVQFIDTYIYDFSCICICGNFTFVKEDNIIRTRCWSLKRLDD